MRLTPRQHLKLVCLLFHHEPEPGKGVEPL